MKEHEIIQFSLLSIQNELRNKEGITGINVLYHIILCFIIKSLDDKNCEIFSLRPEDYNYEKKIKYDCSTILYDKVINILTNKLRVFGFIDYMPFEIKKPETLKYIFNKLDHDIGPIDGSIPDYIGVMYEHFINREKSTMQDYQQYFTDRILCRFMLKLINPNIYNDDEIGDDIEGIYDGACGTGGFFTEYINFMNNKARNIQNREIRWSEYKKYIHGGEINRSTYNILLINLFISTGQIFDHLENTNTLNLEISSKYKNIIMNPPFSINGIDYSSVNHKIKELNIRSTKGEILFLQHAMKHLDENGKCAIVLPRSVLVNSSKMYVKTREELIENYNIKSIYYNERNDFFENTGVQTCIIHFLNSDEKTTEIELFSLKKDNDNIVQEKIFSVHIDDIRKNNHSLNLNLYKSQSINYIKKYKYLRLGDICNIHYGKNISKKNRKGNEYPYYGSNGISGYVDEYMYDGEYLLQGDQGTIIDTIKMVNGKFYPSNHTIVFRPKDGRVKIEYLYYYIKLFVNLDNFLSGSVIKEIRQEDFENINIIVPPLMTQKKIFKLLNNLNQRLHVNLFEPNEILKEKLYNILNDIRNDGKSILEEFLLEK
jgi:type I restriction-modification system DNA methylase subunit